MQGGGQATTQEQKRAVGNLLSYVRDYGTQLAQYTQYQSDGVILRFRLAVQAVNEAFHSYTAGQNKAVSQANNPDISDPWGRCCCGNGCYDTYYYCCPSDCTFNAIGN